MMSKKVEELTYVFNFYYNVLYNKIENSHIKVDNEKKLVSISVDYNDIKEFEEEIYTIILDSEITETEYDLLMFNWKNMLCDLYKKLSFDMKFIKKIEKDGYKYVKNIS